MERNIVDITVLTFARVVFGVTDIVVDVTAEALRYAAWMTISGTMWYNRACMVTRKNKAPSLLLQN